MTWLFRRRLTLIIGVLFVLFSAFIYFISPDNSRAEAETAAEQIQERKIAPAGKLLIDSETNQPAVMPLTFNFVRSPDTAAADGKGRFLIAVNSGYGLTFNSKSKPQQSVSVIDLNKKPEPQVVQNIYFPSPQSANFGLVFDKRAQPNGKFNLYLSGGFENKIWILSFDPNAEKPLAPANAPDAQFDAPFVDVSAFSENAPSPNYNRDTAAVYPTGIDLSPDGSSLFVANNLGDTLGVVADLRDTRRITRVRLQRQNSKQFVYPYDVKILPSKDGKTVDKIYVSLWGDGSIAVVDGKTLKLKTHIAAARHPTLMLFSRDKTRLYVADSDGDSISIINTNTDTLYQSEPKIDIKLAENAQNGMSPQGLALSEDEKTLYVANAKTNAVAVIELDPKINQESRSEDKSRSRILGFIPTGNYASAVAVVGDKLFIANGKGTGMENSSLQTTQTGLYPNMPNEKFPGDNYGKRGMYSAAIVSGNISLVDKPDEKRLFAYTQQVMRENGLLGERKTSIFPPGKSPFKHIIYIIRENRTYDQVFGDLETSGDGAKADGDPSVAIFGAGEIAKSPNGAKQNITPNARALALRFGLLDRFFVNAEASPDGHNWSTAAFSSDYVDKAFRWNYSGRGRTYDFEGFNRLPSYNPPANQPPVALPPVFDLPATENDIADYLKKYVPYLNGARDVAEPETLYLWDAARQAGLSYRNYGEYVATVSENDVKEVNTRRAKTYPDISPTVEAFATKKSLENHFSPTVRNFDQDTPDSLTVDSYRAAVESDKTIDPAITPDNKTEKFRGTSRFGDWQREFRSFVADLNARRGDKLPNLSIIRFSNDHTAGLQKGVPTPQFYVAENDYAVGRLVEEVSSSPYWKDTAIFIVEDDAQAGPDHVDAHRSPAFVISAYNRKGALIHDFHNTVSLIRTMEMLLGIKLMNLLDAAATPIDIFQEQADLTPFKAVLPTVALDNLFPPAKISAALRVFMNLTAKQDLTHQDMANPQQLNEIIWFSVRREAAKMPEIARLPAFDLMTAGLLENDDEEEDEEKQLEKENKSESAARNSLKRKNSR